MKGHWLSQTRKLNRHYQDGELEEGKEGKEEEKKDPDKKTWDGSEPLDLNGALVAPYYGVFMNGKFANYIDVHELSYQNSKIPEIEYAKLNVDVKPYIPRVADKYYDWNEEVIFGQHMEQGKQTELQWLTHKNGMRIIHNDDNFIFADEIGKLPSGIDLSKKEFTLIKPEYDLYILRAKYQFGKYSHDIGKLYEEWVPKEIPIELPKKESNKNPEYAEPAVAYLGFYGYFGEEPHGDLYMRDVDAHVLHFQDIVTVYKDKKYVILTGGSPPTSPSTETSWAGKQYVSVWSVRNLSQYLFPSKHHLPGIVHNHFDNVQYFEGVPKDSKYMYKKMFVLKKVTTIKGALTGW